MAQKSALPSNEDARAFSTMHSCIRLQAKTLTRGGGGDREGGRNKSEGGLDKQKKIQLPSANTVARNNPR